MTRIERSQRIVSPCQNVCKIENDVCIGCFRTLSEISVWSRLSDDKRTKIMESLKKRGSQIATQSRNKASVCDYTLE
jgi:predicted Fe-S protein YdhL (DUF1289 family)